MAENANVLIVDDRRANRELLRDMMIAMGHEPDVAENGLAALAKMRHTPPDVVLLDILMPEMDGHEVLAEMHGDPELRHVPVLVISAVDDTDSMVRAVNAGAADYLTKPFNTTMLRARVGACVERKRLHDHQQRLMQQIEAHNVHLEQRVREQVGELVDSQLATIFALSRLAESRDMDTGKHLERIQAYCRALAGRLSGHSPYGDQMTEPFVRNMCAASALHDIGKVGMPDSVLLKPGPLKPDEFEIIKTHTTIGADALRAVQDQYPGNEFVNMGVRVAQSHHERWDGQGYPEGLRSERIPLCARIVAVADVYDAVTSQRVYRSTAMTEQEAHEILLGGRGTQFDPAVVDAYAAETDTFHEIRCSNLED